MTTALRRSRDPVGPPPCPRCGGPSQYALQATDRNRGITRSRFSYRRCAQCGVLWLPEIPPDLAAYYPAGYHHLPAKDELAAEAAAEAPRLELIARRVGPGPMVEIGPSHGAFAYAARQAGFDVVGLEMDPLCCEYLRDVVGVQAINTNEPGAALAEVAPSRAVVMWHVLEHLPDPWGVLRAAAGNLEPGGVLAVATPNPESLQFRMFRSRWLHLDAPRHLTLVPLPAMREELDRLGLSLVSATARDPVGLDLNRLGWARSILRPPALRPDPRLSHTAGRALTALFAPLETRALCGAAYTAVFQKR